MSIYEYMLVFCSVLMDMHRVMENRGI